MKRFVLVLCVAALAAPAIAHAKGVMGVRVCGSDGCRSQTGGKAFARFGGPFGGPFSMVQPTSPGPWYRAALLIGEPASKARMQLPFFYVRTAHVLVQPGNSKEQPAWWRPRSSFLRMVDRLAAQLKPLPAPRDVHVEVDFKPVADPQSYLRLFTIGTHTDRVPTETAWIEVVFTSKTPTPWTTNVDMVLWPKSHLLVRNGQIFAISPNVARRVSRRASLAGTGGGSPWLPVALGLAPVAILSALVRRRA
jgi:hypothetical protein